MNHQPARIAVIGAGSWGTALAIIAARSQHQVRIWAREPEVASGINEQHRNPYYLSDFELPASIIATTQMSEALVGADFAIIAVPSHAVRVVAREMAGPLPAEAIVISATKGIENGTLMRMSELLAEVLAGKSRLRFVVLSGPSFAREAARGDPTAVVAAAHNPEWAKAVQETLSLQQFRIYTNDDVAGVELGGAVKNVIAIASGIVTGLGLGSNSVAAIITRGLAEVTRLALMQGGRVETLAGLAGLGDLVLTCTGELSRNRHVGVELGKGRRLAEILQSTREIAEGVKTTKSVYELAHRLGVDMPITRSIHALLYQDKPAIEAAGELMGRPLRRE